MMTEEGSTKVISFMTPGAGVLLECSHTSHILEMLNFFKILFSSVEHRSDTLKTKSIVMMTKEGHTKIVYYMTHSG